MTRVSSSIIWYVFASSITVQSLITIKRQERVLTNQSFKFVASDHLKHISVEQKNYIVYPSQNRQTEDSKKANKENPNFETAKITQSNEAFMAH